MLYARFLKAAVLQQKISNMSVAIAALACDLEMHIFALCYVVKMDKNEAENSRDAYCGYFPD